MNGVRFLSARSRWQNGVSVLPHLFGCFEQLLVRRVLVKFAFISGIVATDLRPGFIGPTEIVRQQVFAVGMHHQIPAAIIDEHGHTAVHHVPADVVKVFPVSGFVHRQGKVPTAFCGAVFTEYLAGFEI